MKRGREGEAKLSRERENMHPGGLRWWWEERVWDRGGAECLREGGWEEMLRT